MPNDPNWSDWLSEAEQTLAQAVENTDHTALLYSGGVESLLLLHLADRWRDRITIYTMRTGAEFPHMVEFVDRKMRGWDHHVVTVDLAAS